MVKVSSGSRDAASGELVDALWSFGAHLSYLNIFTIITPYFRSSKEGLEKRPENQDNVVCEK